MIYNASKGIGSAMRAAGKDEKPDKRMRGQALVEFALILPLLLLLLFGIIEFGRALFQKNMTINAARDGARYAAVKSPWNSAAQTDIENHTKGVITLSSVRNSASVGIYPPAAYTNFSSVSVTVTTKFKTVVPKLLIPLENYTSIRASTTMRYEK